MPQGDLPFNGDFTKKSIFGMLGTYEKYGPLHEGEFTMEERRAAYEVMTWIESWQYASTNNTRSRVLANLYTQLNKIIPENLCLHINACYDYIEMPQVKLL